MSQPNPAPSGSEENKNEAAAESAVDSKIEALESAVKEEKNKYLYLYADFENFKKRAVKERSDLMKFGWENIARDLLAVVDNLERAITHSDQAASNLRQGVEMTLNLFRQTLEKQGVTPMTSDGMPFNPEIHEGMGQEPSALPQGTVTQTLVKGYMLHGRLLRPAKVVVSTGVPPTN